MANAIITECILAFCVWFDYYVQYVSIISNDRLPHHKSFVYLFYSNIGVGIVKLNIYA